MLYLNVANILGPSGWTLFFFYHLLTYTNCPLGFKGELNLPLILLLFFIVYSKFSGRHLIAEMSQLVPCSVGIICDYAFEDCSHQ